MNYRIYSITDLDGNEKTDEASVGRIGRIIHITPDEIQIGKSAILECVFPGFWKTLVTSKVKAVIEYDDVLKIKTENSYYFLKRVD